MLVALYPVATVFCIMITGNHYWLDAVGGLVALGGGWLIGSQLAAFNERRLQRKVAANRPTLTLRVRQAEQRRRDSRIREAGPEERSDEGRSAQPADRRAVVAADGDEALVPAGPDGEADLGAVAARLHAQPRRAARRRWPAARPPRSRRAARGGRPSARYCRTIECMTTVVHARCRLGEPLGSHAGTVGPVDDRRHRRGHLDRAVEPAEPLEQVGPHERPQREPALVGRRVDR